MNIVSRGTETFLIGHASLAEPFWPNTLATWVTVIAVCAGALWAIYTFTVTNRAKAAEVLMSVERGYNEDIQNTLIAIEYIRTYQDQFVPAIRVALNTVGNSYEPDESDTIDRLERALRYFSLCAQLNRLHIDRGGIERLCTYNLRLLCSERRSELCSYVRIYWPAVSFWAELAGKPRAVKLCIWVTQIPARFDLWRNGGLTRQVRFARPLTAE